MHQFPTSTSVSITKLKRSPGTVLELADREPVALLNRNRPVAYLLSAATYEAVLERLDDIDLAELIKARRNDPAVEINLGKPISPLPNGYASKQPVSSSNPNKESLSP